MMNQTLEARMPRAFAKQRKAPIRQKNNEKVDRLQRHNKAHTRHIHYDECIDLGLKIDMLDRQ